MPAVRVLSPAEAAALMQGDVRVLADWRCKGIGPPHILVGGMPRYRLEDIHAYLRREQRERQQTAEKMAFVIEQARREQVRHTSYMQPSPRD